MQRKNVAILGIASLATALTGGVLGVRVVEALERVAQPTVNAGSSALQVKASETNVRLNCVNGALNQSVMACPQDCMIPTTNVSVTTVDVCDVSTASSWTCRWPTQWVTEQEDCNNLGFGSGWTNMATVRREYEIQQCGQVVVPTGKPLQLIDVSQCSRSRNETETQPCPTRDNYYLAEEIGGPVGEQWRKITTVETNWAGTGVTLSRPLTEGLTLAGAIERRSQGDWSVTGVQCQRPQQRQVTVPCDGSQVNVCTTPPPGPPTTVVTTTTVMVDGTPRTVTRTIQIPAPPPVPVCNLVAAGNVNQGCITDYVPGSITFDPGTPTYQYDRDTGQYVTRRNWSYTATQSTYSTSCGGAVTGRFNSGVANVTVGLANDLSATTVISSEPPNFLQEYCSQATMNQGWTTHDYGGGDGGGGGGGGAGDGCGCDGNSGGDCGR